MSLPANTTAGAPTLPGAARKKAVEGVRTSRLWAWLCPLMLVGLGVIAVLPLFQAGFPKTDDGVFHVSRMIELSDALGSGWAFPRWADPFVKALGFPIFIFYGPIPYYLSLTVGAFGLSAANAFTLASALAVPAAGLAMYWWMTKVLARAGARGRGLHIAAFGAGLAYEYVPHLLVDAHLRAALAESVAMVMMPLLLCAIDEILWKPKLKSVPFAALMLGALMLTHNTTALLGVGTAFCYVVFRIVVDIFSRSREDKDSQGAGRRLLYLAFAGVLGMGVSAFLWVPALGERGYVPFIFEEQMMSVYFDAAFRLQDCWPPVQGSFLFDIDPTVRFRAGLVQMLLIAPGVIALLLALVRRGRSGASSLSKPLVTLAGFLCLVMIVITFLLSPLSATLWREVSLMASMQFPWRTLTILAVCTAAMTGIGLWWLGKQWPKLLPAISALFAILAIVAIVFTVSPPFIEMPDFSVGFIHKWTSLSGWNIPDEYITTDISAEEAMGLTGLKVMKQESGRIEMEAEATRDTRVALHVLDFPGWKVYVDGRQTELESGDSVLLTFAVPEGRHSVLAQFEDTPLRQGSGIVSGVAGVVLLGILAFSIRRRQYSTPAYVCVAVLAILFAVPRMAATPSPALEYHESTLASANGVRLLGAGLDQPRDGVIGVTLYWQALEPLEDWETFVVLMNEQGDVIGDAGHAAMDRAYSTDDWQIGEIVHDRVELEVPAGFRTENLLLKTGFRPYDPNHLGQPVNRFELPLRGKVSSSGHQTPVLTMGDNLAVRDYEVENSVVSPGDEVNVTLTWEALGEVTIRDGVFVHLVDAGGTMWAQAEGPPGPVGYPMLIWQVGEVARETRSLSLPSDTPPGRYKVTLGGYQYPDATSLPIAISGQDGSVDTVAIGDVFVAPPGTRRAEVSPLHKLDAAFGGQIQLVGFDLSDSTLRPGKDLVLTTYWRGLGSMTSDYTMFAQLLNSAGVLVSQKDAQPAGGGYPTSMWRAGEYVVDSRVISLPPDLPAGEYRLVLGFYEWPSLNRLDVTVGGQTVGTSVALPPLKAP